MCASDFARPLYATPAPSSTDAQPGDHRARAVPLGQRSKRSGLVRARGDRSPFVFPRLGRMARSVLDLNVPVIEPALQAPKNGHERRRGNDAMHRQILASRNWTNVMRHDHPTTSSLPARAKATNRCCPGLPSASISIGPPDSASRAGLRRHYPFRPWFRGNPKVAPVASTTAPRFLRAGSPFPAEPNRSSTPRASGGRRAFRLRAAPRRRPSRSATWTQVERGPPPATCRAAGPM